MCNTLHKRLISSLQCVTEFIPDFHLPQCTFKSVTEYLALQGRMDKHCFHIYFHNLFNPVIPGVLKTNEIPGGGGAPGAPPMKTMKECF